LKQRSQIKKAMGKASKERRKSRIDEERPGQKSKAGNPQKMRENAGLSRPKSLSGQGERVNKQS
jgi:hypothetical protein